METMDKSRSYDSYKVTMALTVLAILAVVSFTLAIATVFENSADRVIAAPRIPAGHSLG